MFKLRIKRASLMYDLVFNHRVNTLCGDSGTGKTYLIESIREVVKGIHTKDYFITSCFGENSYIETDLPLVIPSNLKQMRDLTNELGGSSILFLIDEDFIGLSSFKLADFINTHLNVNILIISREFDNPNLIYSTDSIYKLECNLLDGVEVNKNVNYLTEALFTNSKEFNLNKTIFVEDSAEGKLLLELFTIPEVNVVSTKGKDNVVNSVVESNVEGVRFIVVDMCAYGSNYFKHKKMLEDKGFRPVYFTNYTSFEYVLLCILGLIDKFTSYNEYVKSASESVSEEKYYESLVNVFMRRRYNVPYLKGSSPMLVINKRATDVLTKILSGIPRKWLQTFGEVIDKLKEFAMSSQLGRYLYSTMLTDKSVDISLVKLELLLSLFSGNISKFKSVHLSKVEGTIEYNNFIEELAKYNVSVNWLYNKDKVKLAYFKFNNKEV